MNRSLLSLSILPMLLAACGLGSTPTPHPRDANAPVLEWSDAGMNFKKGYASATGELEGTCVSGAVSPTTVGSPSASYQLDIVDTTQALSESLGVSAEAALDVGLYAASAKADYVQSSQTNSYAVYVIARSDITGPEVTLDNVALLSAQDSPNGQDYQNLYLNDYLAFYNTCGDHYLDSAVTGASYRGVIRIDATSADEQQSIKAELSGRYEAVTGSASVTRAVQEIATRYSVSVQEFYTGVLPDAFASDVQGLIDNATNFPQLFKNQCQGAAVSGTALNCLKAATFQPYSILVVGSPPLAQVQQVQQAIQNAGTLTRYGIGYLVAYNNATFAQANPWLFTDSPATLSALARQASQNLGKVKTALSACAGNLTYCVSPASLGLPDPSTIAGPNWISIGPATSCRDYQLRFRAVSSQPGHVLNDGNYPLYVGGQTARSARIWCRNMGTATPTEYLSLVSADDNFGMIKAGNVLKGTDVVTRYQKIRLNPATLAVDVTDQTYTQSSGSVSDSSGANYTSQDYATASNCNTSVTNPGDLPTARLNLSGTDFNLPPNAFSVFVPPAAPSGGANISYLDAQRVVLTTGFAASDFQCSIASPNVGTDPSTGESVELLILRLSSAF